MATSIHKLALVAFLAFGCLDAQALVFRAYLAADGNDANPCTLVAPCRLLPAALAAVVSGGEIWMLDSANYNTATVNIAKSVTILAVPGVVGSVVATGGPAIAVTTNDLIVTLRNLVIAPLPGAGGTNGVTIDAANSTVMIERSVITGLQLYGVFATGASRLVVTDSVLRNCGQAIALQNGMLGEIGNSRVIQNGNGIVATSSVASITRATVNDTTISGGYVGLHALATITDGASTIDVTRSTIHTASFALAAETSGGGSASILVGSTQVHNSGAAWWFGGAFATVRSYGNNQMFNNGPSTGTLTATPLL